MNITDEMIDTLTESDAFTLYHKMAHKFGWAGTFFTREDANEAFQNIREDVQTGDMTDELWEYVRTSWGWDRMNEILCERGWDMVDEAVRDAMEKFTK